MRTQLGTRTARKVFVSGCGGHSAPRRRANATGGAAKAWRPICLRNSNAFRTRTTRASNPIAVTRARAALRLQRNSTTDMRALFVSELGAGHGNVGPLVLLAEQMAGRGVQPIFAMADGGTPASLFDARSWPVLAAPALREPLRPRQGPTGYGDILASC